MEQGTLLFSRYQPGGAISVVDIADTQGEVFFVGSVAVFGGVVGSDATGFGRSPLAPFATLDYAVGQCTAGQRDTIYLLPGHNENIANAQIDIDIASTRVIGLGRGTLIPRFDFDHANASIDIGANDVLLRNIRLLPSVTDVLIGIDVETLFTDVLIEDVEALPGEDGAGVDDFAAVVEFKVGCTRGTVRRLKVRQHASGAGYIAGVRLKGASDDILIEDCDIKIIGVGVVAPINGDTTLSTNLRVRRCVLTSDAEPGVEMVTGTTGTIEDCYMFTDLATMNAAIVADGCASFNNKYVEVGPESGGVIGTASVDD